MNIDQINQTLAAIGLSPLTEESILAYQRQPADDESRPFRRAIDGASEAYDAELNRLASGQRNHVQLDGFDRARRAMAGWRWHWSIGSNTRQLIENLVRHACVVAVARRVAHDPAERLGNHFRDAPPSRGEIDNAARLIPCHPLGSGAREQPRPRW